MPTVCGGRAEGARSLRSPMLVDRSRFSSHGDKLNRQIQEVERLVTRRKQRIALTSNRQKIQFSKTKNSAATEAPNTGQRRLARMKLPARRGARKRNKVVTVISE